MTRSAPRRPRPGRPRALPYAGFASPRDQILDAAARLFATHGFAATSTREISEASGIRQSSLYYHFDSKDEVLAELLQRSVRPTVDKIEKIERLVPPETRETALYLLALADVSTLATAPHNVGMLYRLPDVAQSPAYKQFRTTRQELADAYGRLGTAIAQSAVADLLGPARLGEMLIQVVDTVINMRSAGERIDERARNGIATSCLRICGLGNDQITAAATAAAALFSTFTSEAA